jgi:outer membrane receptor protein involved in Fe transport
VPLAATNEPAKIGSRSAVAVRAALVVILAVASMATAMAAERTKRIGGIVVTNQNELVPNATVTIESTEGALRATTGRDGAFQLTVPDEAVMIRVEGKDLEPIERVLEPDDLATDLRLVVDYVVPPIHESVVIVDRALDPTIERRNGAIYDETLFSRDDQIFDTLAAGIDAGQHEGGGKSLEIRRFGFNMDHGGVNGGLKVLVDDVQQNHATQGHGQGYLGQLKSLTPELVAEVSVVNGPFSAQYGDFSGLGVVHIQLKESLPDELTVRLQRGSFDTLRGFVAYSPDLGRDRAFLAYEGSRTDGPFLNPLRYARDNLTGNYTVALDERRSLAFKLNYGRNDYYSSGQLPLDLVFANELDRFGFVDPDNGGRVDSGVFSTYYRHERENGDVFKIDGFVARSLFDHFINFTFFLDEANGDEIDQHDSRLQEGINTQYIKPHSFLGNRALLTVGGNFHDNQIYVALWRSRARDPFEVSTAAHAHVTNVAGYAENTVDFFHGHLRVATGLRYDLFRFGVEDLVDAGGSGVEPAGRWQPKAGVAWTVSDRIPVTLSLNYGRGISSQDARSVVRQPDSPKVSTTDFYQAGAVINTSRFSFASDLFLIDRSNEQVYIPDDGSTELAGPSRAYGWEAKSSVQLSSTLALNGGFTKVGNAFYRGTLPRVYVDGAPHFVANAGLTLSEWHGVTASLRYRHASSYRLDREDARIRASGLDVVDFSLAKRLRRWIDLNVAIDNLTNKRYFETQNHYASRVAPGAPVVERVHATPGYPITLTVGFTLRLGAKK